MIGALSSDFTVVLGARGSDRAGDRSVLVGLAVAATPAAPALAAGLAVAAFNTGIALGSWIAGDALVSSLGATGPALVGAVMAMVGLVPFLVLAGSGRRRATRPAGQSSSRDAELEAAARAGN